MKKWVLTVLGVVIVALFIVYAIPTKPQDFFELYSKQDEASKSLKEFLAQPTKSVSVNGEEWLYFSGGTGNQTILFIHGMGGAYQLWWQQNAALENDYRVISFSLPEGVNNLNGAYTGILKILEIENVKNFNVVGTSMGGYIAQYLVNKIPNRIDKVVFGNTFPPNTILAEKNASISKVIPYFPEVLISSLGDKKLRSDILPAAKNSELLAAFLPSLPFSKKQFINRYYVVIDPFVSHPNEYKIKRIPKLIIESDNDPLVELQLREDLKKLYPSARFRTFHNEGHFPYINAAREYNQFLTEFFASPDEFKEAEKTVKAYFEGRRTANIEMLSEVFAENAELFAVLDNELRKIPVQEYFEKVKADGPSQIKTTILDGNITNNMAVFKTRFQYGDKEYQDYLTLLKVSGKWKIVSKTFTKLN